MEKSQDKIERLMFVKYLLIQAEHQRELERPISSTTILTLHDLIECFLQLGFELLTGKGKLSSNNILDAYTDAINNELLKNGDIQINKSFIKRLNELRNQLKHSTIFIDKRNIINLFYEVENFVNDFTQVIFKMSLNEISMLNLISDKDIRTYLYDAESQINNNELTKAIINIGKAFSEFESLATSLKDKNGYELIRTNPNKVNYQRYLKTSSTRDNSAMNFSYFIKNLTDDINKINSEMLSIQKTQLLYLDMRKYLIFHDLVPRIWKVQRLTDDGYDYEFLTPDNGYLEDLNISIEQVKFCYDFVVETILNHQNKSNT